jgi:hypothetical protein
MMNDKHQNLIETILMLAPMQIPKKLKMGNLKNPLATTFKENDLATSKSEDDSKKIGCSDCNKINACTKTKFKKIDD